MQWVLVQWIWCSGFWCRSESGRSTGAVATTGLMLMVMAWLPVEMTASAGLRAEELVATPHGCGFLNGTGTARACALKQNCCHGVSVKDLFVLCLSHCGERGDSRLQRYGFRIFPSGFDGSRFTGFFHLAHPHHSWSTHRSVFRSRCHRRRDFGWPA